MSCARAAAPAESQGTTRAVAVALIAECGDSEVYWAYLGREVGGEGASFCRVYRSYF